MPLNGRLMNIISESIPVFDLLKYVYTSMFDRFSVMYPHSVLVTLKSCLQSKINQVIQLDPITVTVHVDWISLQLNCYYFIVIIMLGFLLLLESDAELEDLSAEMTRIVFGKQNLMEVIDLTQVRSKVTNKLSLFPWVSEII